ncbi:hypothetical protein [Occallatibacter riparius]|uniref:Uncharacterized protein n=1 Tax=Occallatibacter riparius TaxID=1002689 RepID=A0A9J7BKF0_9BACT|nr:hypothetical protein [Occallatibacter riparius]UWZ83067.1 hypothetical protein MOP44_21160 [Occallatibacter riparius]
MDTKLVMSDEDEASDKLSRQALSFFLHLVVALGTWVGLMLVGYAVQPSVPQAFILLLSLVVPAGVGFLFLRAKPEPMAGHVWLAGVIWMMIVSLWILDMPTGPNACNDCNASEKLTRALFSFPRPSGLIDDNGPFLCTWPAAALIGYSIGARLAMRRKD